MEKIMLNDTGEWVDVPQIIAVDYDGTIDFAGFPKVGKIDELALNALKAWKARGNKLILWTCRSGDHLSQAINCCKDKGLEFDAVNENIAEIKKAGFESPKVFANLYIDDRAMGRTGLTDIWQSVSKVCGM